jgi:hypothetical protein
VKSLCKTWFEWERIIIIRNVDVLVSSVLLCRFEISFSSRVNWSNWSVFGGKSPNRSSALVSSSTIKYCGIMLHMIKLFSSQKVHCRSKMSYPTTCASSDSKNLMVFIRISCNRYRHTNITVNCGWSFNRRPTLPTKILHNFDVQRKIL